MQISGYIYAQILAPVTKPELRFSSANRAGLFTADVMFIYIFVLNDIK